MTKLPKWTHDIISRVAKYHSSKTFSYFTQEDLEQEIWIICIDRFAEFDENEGKDGLTKEEKLEHYLRSVVSKRLINKFKTVTRSAYFPCKKCPHYDKSAPSDCSLYGDQKMQCDKWSWYQSNHESRNALLAISPYEEKSKDCQVEITIMGREIKQMVSDNIGRDNVYDFNQWISNGKMPKQREERIIRCVRDTFLNPTGKVEISGLMLVSSGYMGEHYAAT